MSEPPENVDLRDLKETFLECSICFDTFDQTDRRPRLLHSCLHALCTECLERLLEKEGENQITCPLCRRVQSIRGSVQTLPIDPVRNKLVDYVRLKNQKTIPCSDCKEDNAVSRCQECQWYLCKECDYIHKNHGLTKGHVIVSLEEVLQQPIKNLSPGHMCPKHPKHHLEFYCTIDEELCCVSCTVLDHKGHDLIGLDKADADKRTKIETHLNDAIITADGMRTARQQMAKHLKYIDRNKSKSMNDISAMFTTLREELDQRERFLIAALDEKSKQTMSTIQKSRDALDQTIAVIESTETYYTEAKQNADVVEMLNLYPTLMRSLADLEQPQNTQTAVQFITFEKNGNEEVKKAVKSLGQFKKRPDPMPRNEENVLNVGGLEIYILKADMTTLPLDAIVNTANGRLFHSGGLARAISDAAGPDLNDECRRYVSDNGEIPVTGVVRHTAGNLLCVMVLHAVGPFWSDYRDHEKNQCSDDLCMTVLRCLIEADRNSARDVAIPAISSGVFRVPRDICCAAYVRGVKLFGQLCQSRTLKRAYFVDINDGMLAGIQEEFERCKDQPLYESEREKKFIQKYKDQGNV